MAAVHSGVQISGAHQFQALSVIRERPGIGVKELARTLDIKQSSASNLVRALLGRDLVAATRDGPDWRTVALHLQDAGAAVLARLETDLGPDHTAGRRRRRRRRKRAVGRTVKRTM